VIIVSESSKAAERAMIVSTVYLPGTTVNVQHQDASTRSICAGRKRCPYMIGTVRW
jgi:hypothetical protein